MQILKHPEDTQRPEDPRNNEVVFPAYDVSNGNLATPINSSSLVKSYINALPAYRKGLSASRRGLEVGMAHGYWLLGPFAKLGPLRDTDIANVAGLISTIGLILISSITISAYASSNPPQPATTITTPNPPDSFKSADGWNDYGSGFLMGGIGGAVVAYLILSNIALLKNLFSGL